MTRSFRSLAVVSCCTAAALLAACGPSTSLPADYASCQTPDVICLASANATPQCVNLDTDTNNCGECGNVCPVPQQGGTASCLFGQCQMGCANGLTVCGVAQSTDGGADAGFDAPICIDTSVDPNHCGTCDTRCTASQICTAGACVAAGTPAQGTTACGFLADGGVVYDNLQTDRNNCGACGNACATNEICESGACQPCAVTQCNNSCVDTTVDSSNCGSCGNVCAGASACNASSCVAMAITVLAPTTSGFLPVGSPTVSVNVAWGIRVAQVTVVAKLTNSGTTTTSNPYTLSFSSDENLSPTTASFNWGNLQTGSGTMLTSMPGLIWRHAGDGRARLRRL